MGSVPSVSILATMYFQINVNDIKGFKKHSSAKSDLLQYDIGYRYD